MQTTMKLTPEIDKITKESLEKAEIRKERREQRLNKPIPYFSRGRAVVFDDGTKGVFLEKHRSSGSSWCLSENDGKIVVANVALEFRNPECKQWLGGTGL